MRYSSDTKHGGQAFKKTWLLALSSKKITNHAIDSPNNYWISFFKNLRKLKCQNKAHGILAFLGGFCTLPGLWLFSVLMFALFNFSVWILWWKLITALTVLVLSAWFLYLKLQLIFHGLIFSWDSIQLWSARGIRCYSVIHPVPKESYIKIILFSLAPGKLGGRLWASRKDEGMKKKAHHLQRGSRSAPPLLSHCTELGKSVLHCSATVSIAIEGQFKEKQNH